MPARSGHRPPRVSGSGSELNGKRKMGVKTSCAGTEWDGVERDVRHTSGRSRLQFQGAFRIMMVAEGSRGGAADLPGT